MKDKPAKKQKPANLGAMLRPDPSDDRDFKFSSIPDESRVIKMSSSLPTKMNWKEEMSPIKYQGNLGCHDIHTEILTENGWKLFKDLEEKERVATVNSSTNTIEYQIPINYMEYDYDGEMYYFNHKHGLNAMVTPNHKMYVRKWDTKSVSLKEKYELEEAQNIGWYSGLLTIMEWQGHSPLVIKMPDVEIGIRKGSKQQSIRAGEEIKTSEFVKFLGLYMAEGCCYLPEGSGSYRIEIAASDNNIRKEKVIEIINGLPYKYTIYHDRITIWNKSLYSFLKPIGNVYSKRIPRFVMDLNKNDISEFLYGYYLGDGSFHDDGARTGYSVSEGLVDDIQELILKTGRLGRKKVRQPRTAYIKGIKVEGKECFEIYERIENTKLSIDRNKYLSKIPYNNKVYCVEVPNHILITRRRGCVLVSGNSCVGFASCALKEWQEKKEHEAEVADGKEDHRNNEDYNLSEQWVYWNCKKIDPWPGEQGTNFRSALKVLQKIGVPIEKAWPYSDDPVNIGKPSNWAHLIARWSTVESYWRVNNNIPDIKRALAEGPILFGMTCFEEMYGKLEDGRIPYPDSPNEAWGYHAVLAIGFDDERGEICFKNSWSKFWGEAGYGYLPYKYVEDHCWDHWAVKDMSVTPDMLKGTVKLIE